MLFACPFFLQNRLLELVSEKSQHVFTGLPQSNNVRAVSERLCICIYASVAIQWQLSGRIIAVLFTIPFHTHSEDSATNYHSSDNRYFVLNSLYMDDNLRRKLLYV